MAIDGRQNILDIPASKPHDRVPIFLGSKRDVEKIKELYEEYDKKAGREPEAKKSPLPTS